MLLLTLTPQLDGNPNSHPNPKPNPIPNPQPRSRGTPAIALRILSGATHTLLEAHGPLAPTPVGGGGGGGGDGVFGLLAEKPRPDVRGIFPPPPRLQLLGAVQAFH